MRAKRKLGSTFGFRSLTDVPADQRCSTHEEATRAAFQSLHPHIPLGTCSGRLTNRVQEETTIS
jgi:hypothetical protein